MARTAVITGGAGGLGGAMAAALLGDGHNVVLADIGEGRVAEAVARYPSAPGRVLGVAADIARFEDRERLIRLTQERFGQVDILINNAGIGFEAIRKDFVSRPVHFWEVSVSDFERFSAVHCTAPFHLASLVVPKMMEQRWGRIVNVTTSLDSMLKVSFYGPSKAALEANTSTMALELKEYGITANVLVPGGMTATGMTAALNIPIEKQFRPDIMAEPIRWLASPASDEVTARRFIAVLWDRSLPQVEAIARSGSVVGWTGYGVQGIHPADLAERLPIQHATLP